MLSHCGAKGKAYHRLTRDRATGNTGFVKTLQGPAGLGWGGHGSGLERSSQKCVTGGRKPRELRLLEVVVRLRRSSGERRKYRGLGVRGNGYLISQDPEQWERESS